ncbi:hypothetical protein D6858_10275 [Tsuneonella suprasediminis]|uniref:Uncharacterized protein n=1 Tax=Tsuneonella suprasediminis TaxID=2306996 RepID=A0A419QZV0_9SPHN|nr:hypothetical protein D6858_10275 [Tsuneonella suprasediminis]
MRIDAEHRIGRKTRGHFIERQLLRQAGTAHRFVSSGGLQHQSAIGTGADHRILRYFLARGGIGAGDRHPVAQRTIHQRGGAKQVCVAVFLYRPAGQAGDDGADSNHPFGHAIEAHRRFARWKSNGARLAHHRKAPRPVAVHRLIRPALRIAIDSHRQMLRRRSFHRRARGLRHGWRCRQRQRQCRRYQEAHSRPPA